jgi:hypothetical protein
LSMNSQAALEMIAMFTKPVCLVGRSAFSGAGFTRDVARLEDFDQTLRELLADPSLSQQQHDRALLHVDRLVFNTLIPTSASSPGQLLSRKNDAAKALLGEDEAGGGQRFHTMKLTESETASRMS